MPARSMRKTATPKIKAKKPEPPTQRPEDLLGVEDIDTTVDNTLKNNHALKKDDNGLTGQRHVITCVCCGKPKYDDFFYMNKTSKVFSGVWNRIPICKICLDTLYRSYAMQYDEKASAAQMASIMDLPFVESFALTCMENGMFKVGKYCRSQSLMAMNGKTFIDSIIAGSFFDAKDKLKAEVERQWEPQEKRNKKHVITKFGYDPFDGFGLEDADYRSAFNIMAAYLEDESILQDAHKMQSLVTMIMTIIQSNKIETLLTYQYRNIKPDTSEIKTLTSTMKDLQTTISKIAEDNNISSKYQKENKSAQNHLTAKMKEMATAEYWEAKPNMFDVRTSAAMRQMLDLSHQSIMGQLELADSDYAQMVKEQREMIKVLQEKADRLEEELRNMTNKYIAVTNGEGDK